MPHIRRALMPVCSAPSRKYSSVFLPVVAQAVGLHFGRRNRLPHLRQYVSELLKTTT